MWSDTGAGISADRLPHLFERSLPPAFNCRSTNPLIQRLLEAVAAVAQRSPA